MRVPPKLRAVNGHLTWTDRIFLVLLALYILLGFLTPFSNWLSLVRFLTIIFGLITGFRLIRLGIRRSIWRLRNRLLVTYMFIAVVPVTLIATLAALGAWALASQFAVYLVTSELDRRVAALQWTATTVSRAPAAERTLAVDRMGPFIRQLFPGAEVIVQPAAGALLRYPHDSKFDAPSPEWSQSSSGMLLKDSRFYAYSFEKTPASGTLVIAPITRAYLSGLIPNLGIVSFWRLSETEQPQKDAVQLKLGDRDVELKPAAEAPETNSPVMPPRAWRGDVEVRWFSEQPLTRWESPNAESSAILQVRSRPSAVFGTLFSRRSDTLQGAFPIALVVASSLFLIVELVSLIIGISMTRTITSAVHHLYEATQRVRSGDFSHRIEVRGGDQLADLSSSFNAMTERVQELLIIAKEKERLQSEIEIAREVQSQLYPKKVPDVRTLRLTAVCKPARMVSGDYFDYECLQNTKVAMAVGDVAGKGISAALLMATLQSSLRTEFRTSLEMAAAVGDGSRQAGFSTSQLVSHLNQQLYSYTSPEKYATFYLAIFDEVTSTLTYTNAGHLPPAIIRNGTVTRLNVDGTVVGAFPFAQYDESRVVLEPGDLLVCFTDGVTEPENVYGEMFGEDRLVDLVARNNHRPEPEIIEIVTEAVQQWTGSPELQDDMTLLLARRQ